MPRWRRATPTSRIPGCDAVRRRLVPVVVALALGAGSAAAHDSWLSPARDPSARPPDSYGWLPVPVRLELGTGNRFPVQQFTQAPESVARGECRDAGGGTTPLKPVAQHPEALELQATPVAAASAPSSAILACWAELQPAEIVLEPPTVQIYLAEIKASMATRSYWNRLLTQGEPWRETYRKYARIELNPGQPTAPERLAAARQPAGLDLELLVLGAQPITVGAPLDFQVLRDGQPLAGLPVELVSERSALGIWRVTDSEGKLRHRLPFAGRWLLRAVDLRPDENRPDAWQSRFVTLAIDAR